MDWIYDIDTDWWLLCVGFVVKVVADCGFDVTDCCCDRFGGFGWVGKSGWKLAGKW